MKKFAGCLAIVLLVSLFLSCGSSYALPKSEADSANQLSSVNGEENTYYLSSVSSNISFRVLSTIDKNAPDFNIIDSSGSPVLTNVVASSEGVFEISAPGNGYIPGERYTLSLGPHIFFENEEWKNIRTLIFCIEKEDIAEYVYMENVREQNAVITKLSDNIVSIENMDVATGDILFGQNEAGEYVAYKIKDILEDEIAEVTFPALDEIYSKLEVYGDYEMNVSDIAFDSSLEAEIIENVKKSAFYTGLIATAYAADIPQIPELKVAFEPDEKNNTVHLQIEFTLHPGQKGLFGLNGLKNHDVLLVLEAELWFGSHINIQNSSNWDISTTVRSSLKWNVQIIRTINVNEKLSSGLNRLLTDAPGDLIDATILDQYYKKSIIEQLTTITVDVIDDEGIKLFNWEMPIPAVPGLCLDVEVKLFLKLEMFIKAMVGQEISSTYTIGACLLDDEYTSYSSKQFDGGKITASFGGKASIKAGLKISFGLTIINDKIASLKISSKFGFYADIFATIPLTSDDINLEEHVFEEFFYFEPGVYYEVSVETFINLIVTDIKYEFKITGDKFPFEKWERGNQKLAMGITPMQDNLTVIDYSVYPPDFCLEYYNVKTGIVESSVIKANDMSFALDDGTELVLQQNEVICLPDRVFAEDSIFITASYVHSDGEIYEASFEVRLHTTTIETPYFFIELPEDWAGKYYSFTNLGTPEELSIVLYEKENYDAAEKEGLFTEGRLARICLYNEEDKANMGGPINREQDDEYFLPLEYKDSCCIDGNVYDIIVIHPTDIQFIFDGPEDEPYMVAYQELESDLFADQYNENSDTDHLRIIVKDEYAVNVP